MDTDDPVETERRRQGS